MNTEVLGVIAQIVLLIVLSYPLGKYIAKVYKGEKTWSDFMKPVERVMFKLSGINPNEEMKLETVFESLAGGKSILVPLGDGTVGYTRCAAA